MNQIFLDHPGKEMIALNSAAQLFLWQFPMAAREYMVPHIPGYLGNGG
jgi:hypothetical protein